MTKIKERKGKEKKENAWSQIRVMCAFFLPNRPIINQYLITRTKPPRHLSIEQSFKWIEAFLLCFDQNIDYSETPLYQGHRPQTDTSGPLIRTSSMAHSTGGSRGAARPPSLFLDQNEALRAEKNFFCRPGPPLSEGVDPPLPSVHTRVKPVLLYQSQSQKLFSLITVKLICIKRSPVLSGCTRLFQGPSKLYLLSLQLYLH